MSHRQRMPQLASRKWCRIAAHKTTHFARSRFRGDVVNRLGYIDRWVHSAAPVTRYRMGMR